MKDWLRPFWQVQSPDGMTMFSGSYVRREKEKMVGRPWNGVTTNPFWHWWETALTGPWGPLASCHGNGREIFWFWKRNKVSLSCLNRQQVSIAYHPLPPSQTSPFFCAFPPFSSMYLCYLHLTLPSTLTTSLGVQGPLPSCKAPGMALLLLLVLECREMEETSGHCTPRQPTILFWLLPSIQNPQKDETVIKLLGFPAACKSENRVHGQSRQSADQSAQQEVGRTQMGKAEEWSLEISKQ